MQPERPSREWPLDPEHAPDIVTLRAALPRRRVVCSTMRRAIETAELLGAPAIDARLDEVPRPWSDDLDAAIARYFAGEPREGWEPQGEARARMDAAIREHGDAIYVSHGTVLSLYLASVVPGLDALGLWNGLRNPDAYELRGNALTHLAEA